MAIVTKLPKRRGLVPPASLSATAKDHWRKLVLEYGISDSAGLLLLEDALTSWDTAQVARRRVLKEGQTVKGSHGGLVTHPCVAISRNATSAFQRSMRQLNLDLLPIANKPGRPPRE